MNYERRGMIWDENGCQPKPRPTLNPVEFNHEHLSLAETSKTTKASNTYKSKSRSLTSSVVGLEPK